MLSEAKKLLEDAVGRAVPGAEVVRSAEEEERAAAAGKFPLVALLGNPGTFDETEARTVRFRDDDGRYRERHVRGKRSLPILVRCREADEEGADALLATILPELPARWEHDGFVGEVRIGAEERSDHAEGAAGGHVSVVEVIFTAPVARQAEEIPLIEKTEPGGGEFARSIGGSMTRTRTRKAVGTDGTEKTGDGLRSIGERAAGKAVSAGEFETAAGESLGAAMGGR